VLCPRGRNTPSALGNVLLARNPGAAQFSPPRKMVAPSAVAITSTKHATCMPVLLIVRSRSGPSGATAAKLAEVVASRSLHAKLHRCPNSRAKKCPPIVKLVVCNNFKCPIDCKTTKWTTWGWWKDGPPRVCSNKCGPGRQVRSRRALTKPRFGGRACGQGANKVGLEVEQNCIGLECAVHCTTSKWTKFTKCSALCGGGMSRRSRSVVSHALHGGYKCPVLVDIKRCNVQPCPIACTVGGWSEFGECSHTCGSAGKSTRIRMLVKHARYGGDCVPLKEMKKCGGGTPCPVDCVQDKRQWGKWSLCNKACGQGTQTRRKRVITAAAHGGAPCTNTETRECKVKECGCSHVRCEMRSNPRFKNDLTVVVKHHKLERMGNHHTCKFNHKYKDCECVCKQRRQ